MKIIELTNLKYTYSGQGKETLDIKKFEVFKNEKVFLFGPSGCGKTTLLEVLAGVLVPQLGQVKIAGTDLVSLSSSKRDLFRAAHTGYIFQSFNLIPYLSVYENIVLPLKLSTARENHISKKTEKDEVEFICQSLGIYDFLNKNVTELSVGQQQRVAAARALIGRPELILADEPTSSLDFEHREKFIKLLFELCSQSQISLLFVSHDQTLKYLFDKAISLPEINLAGGL